MAKRVMGGGVGAGERRREGGASGGLVHRHSPEVRRRGSAWRRAVDGLCETRGLQRRHLLRRQRVEGVEIHGQTRAITIGCAGASGRHEGLGGGRDVRRVLLPGVGLSWGKSGVGAAGEDEVRTSESDLAPQSFLRIRVRQSRSLREGADRDPPAGILALLSAAAKRSSLSP